MIYIKLEISLHFVYFLAFPVKSINTGTITLTQGKLSYDCVKPRLRIIECSLV
jgi:hypothetical protein